MLCGSAGRTLRRVRGPVRDHDAVNVWVDVTDASVGCIPTSAYPDSGWCGTTFTASVVLMLLPLVVMLVSVAAAGDNEYDGRGPGLLVTSVIHSTRMVSSGDDGDPAHNPRGRGERRAAVLVAAGSETTCPVQPLEEI